MLNIKFIPKKALVLALGGCMLFPNVSLAREVFGCHIWPVGDYHLARDIINIGGGRERPRPLNINIRPMTVTFEGVEIQASRHHIIPFNTLRSFFNAVVQSQDPHALQTIAEVLIQLTEDALLDQTYFNDAITRDHLENARSLALQMRRGTFNGQTLSPTHYAEPLGVLITLFSWMPGNIFIGPEGRLRIDDPGDSFEYNSEQIIDQEQFDNLYDINRRMLEYINGNGNTNHHLVDIVNRLNNLDNNQLHFYRETQWRRDPDGRYYIFNNINNRRPRNTDSVLEKPPIKQEDEYCLIATEIARKELLAALF